MDSVPAYLQIAEKVDYPFKIASFYLSMPFLLHL